MSLLLSLNIFHTFFWCCHCPQELNKTGSFDTRYGTIQIKQYHTVNYLGWALDENLSEETMDLKVISKLTVDLGFCTEKKFFCGNLFVDYFATL